MIIGKKVQKDWMSSCGHFFGGIGVFLTGVSGFIAVIYGGGQFIETKKLESIKAETEIKENFVKNRTPEAVINKVPVDSSSLEFGDIYLPTEKKEAVQQIIDDHTIPDEAKQTILQQELKVKK
jgi:hypothetical protein